MNTPEDRRKFEEEEALKEIVRKGIDMRMAGAISRAEAKRYWLGHLPNLPTEVVAEVLAYHLQTTEHLQLELLKDLLRRPK